MLFKLYLLHSQKIIKRVLQHPAIENDKKKSDIRHKWQQCFDGFGSNDGSLNGTQVNTT